MIFVNHCNDHEVVGDQLVSAVLWPRSGAKIYCHSNVVPWLELLQPYDASRSASAVVVTHHDNIASSPSEIA